jgi:2-hydroxychromene-2-carboxylate isomerase
MNFAVFDPLRIVIGFVAHPRIRAGCLEIAAGFDALTQQAIDAGVFGVPWCVHPGVPFRGQERLDFRDRSLAQ